MQYAGLELRETDGTYYFEDPTLAKTHAGKCPNRALREKFMQQHLLKESHSRKHPSWVAVLPADVRRSMREHGYSNFFAPSPEFAVMERLHDHAKLFVMAGQYVYTTQPYDVSLEKYQQMEALFQDYGLHVDISYQDAWHYPGKTPLIVVSQVRIRLTK